MERGETLLEAGLRELKEETGLVLSSRRPSQLLCLWESVYPFILSMGQPKRHHLVVYIKVSAAESKETMEGQVSLDKNEVDASMWVNTSLARLVAADEVGQDCPSTLKVTVLDEGGQQSEMTLPSVLMTNQAPTVGQDVERVSTGTRYALGQWLLQQDNY